MNFRILFFLSLSIISFSACSPERDDDFNLGPLPGAPTFTIEQLANDSNRVVIHDETPGVFQRLWDLPGAAPKNSTKATDTIAYAKAGTYTVTLFVSKDDGNGSASASKEIVILKDAPLACDPKLDLLTGGCGPVGRCWIFTTAAGAVKVGPSYQDFSWYTSPVNGLQDAQYDDAYCFTFENFVFQYKNNGGTVDPWDGYMVKSHDPGISEFTFSKGTGNEGRDQIILPEDQFMGVWDSDNVLDIVTLTESLLVVRGRLVNQDGTPQAEGWFEFTFIPQ